MLRLLPLHPPHIQIKTKELHILETQTSKFEKEMAHLTSAIRVAQGLPAEKPFETADYETLYKRQEQQQQQQQASTASLTGRKHRLRYRRHRARSGEEGEAKAEPALAEDSAAASKSDSSDGNA